LSPSRPFNPSHLVSTVANWCKTVLICIPLVATAACPRPPSEHSFYDDLPRNPIKDPALWRWQLAEQVCPGHPIQDYTSLDLEFGKTQLIFSPCAFGRIGARTVFYNFSKELGGRKFCPIGEVWGSGITQLPPGKNGYVRIESSAWQRSDDGSAMEEYIHQYELRPSGLVQISKTRRVLNKN